MPFLLNRLFFHSILGPCDFSEPHATSACCPKQAVAISCSGKKQLCSGLVSLLKRIFHGPGSVRFCQAKLFICFHYSFAAEDSQTEPCCAMCFCSFYLNLSALKFSLTLILLIAFSHIRAVFCQSRPDLSCWCFFPLKAFRWQTSRVAFPITSSQ